MRSRLARGAVVICVALASAVVQAGPAAATTEATAEFVATMHTTPLGWECVPNPITCVSPGPAFSFYFISSSCTGEKVDVAKPKGTAVYGPNCAIVATGMGNGYCHQMTATGTGTIGFNGPTGSKSLHFAFSLTVHAGTVVIYGSAQKNYDAPGTVFGVGEVAPTYVSAGGSCLDRTATQFTFSAPLVYTEPTLI